MLQISPAGVRSRRFALLALPLALLAACESESAPPAPLPSGTLQVDATSQTAFRYFSFDNNGAVVTVTDPRTSSAWDVAFRRFEVRLNGGVAGPKGVVGFNLANNAAVDTSAYHAMTAENQRAAFEAVGAAAIPADTAFRAEALGPDFSTWFRFNPAANTIVANSQLSWRLRRGADGFALFRVASITVAGNSMTTAVLQAATIEYRLQAPGGVLGPVQSATVALGGQPRSLSLSTGAVVDAPSGCNWDLRLTPGVQLLVNADPTCNRGTFPSDITESFTALTRADDAPAYGPFLALVSGPIPNSFTDRRAPFLYDLRRDQRMTPTFNIFLVRRGAEVYRFQITDYYSPSAQPGVLTVRWARIR
ncbi:MAG: HmuY family protein [Gemmatimonadales bacterium]|nr:HmuY family protein [Gemmatimonadales bacterium]